ncbi:MAG: hypothetical protein EOO69_03885 [Moraxellaceae bacterium]|nr:MAG: hypothetical protein EOO69_03885 [Moraxellaceae bacterium]
MSGFIAGTLIKVKEDKNLPLEWWKPIEQLQVGDLVLSRPDTDEDIQDYKPVVKTFKYTKKEIWALRVYDLVDDITTEQPGLSTYFVTLNHPVWKCGTASSSLEKQSFKKATGHWLRVDQLLEGDVIKGVNNNLYLVGQTTPLYQLKDSTLAWLPSNDEYRIGESYGHVINLNELTTSKVGLVRTGKGCNNYYLDENEEHIPYAVEIYNIEVADFYTYCVGMDGIWVQNANFLD